MLVRRVFVLGVTLASPAFAATPGFVQDFVGAGNTGFFGGGGAMEYTNPGADGVGGPSDGYLHCASIPTFLTNFAAFTAADEFTGNYPTSGVGGISFWVRDVGAPQSFELHLGLGPAQVNFWQFNFRILPTPEWTKVYINLTTINPSQWTQTHGSGALAEALADVRRLNIRHDLAPYQFFPDRIEGDLGIDRVRLHPPCPGETNGDDLVNFADLNNCLANFGQSGINLPGDVNSDGTVSFGDLNIILSAFGSAC